MGKKGARNNGAHAVQAAQAVDAVDAQPPRDSRMRRRLCITLLTLPVAWLAAELALRSAGFLHQPRVVPFVLWSEVVDEGLVDGTSTHRLDDTTLWSPRPSAMLTPDTAPTINAQGFRGPVLSPERTPESLRVALLGESTFFGFGVESERTATARLPLLLADLAPVEVFNASVIGFTIAQGIERYRTVVAPLHPDIVCVAYGNHNEAEPVRGPTDTEKLALARDRMSGWRGLLHAARNGSRVLQALDWLGECLRDAPVAESRQPGEFAGWGGPDWPGSRRVPVPQFAQLLETLAEQIEADGSRLVLCRLPMNPSAESAFRVMGDYGTVLEESARRRGLPLLDLGLALDRAARGGVTTADFFLPGDIWHLSSRGQALLAQQLATCIREEALAAKAAGDRPPDTR